MSFGVSGWKSDARYWMWPRPGPSSVWPPPYACTPSRSHQSYISNRLLSGPKRDGLMFTIRGLHGRRSTSATEWIGASQVTRSLTGVEERRVSSFTSGSSSHASGNASITIRYSSGSVSTSTGVPLYWPFRSSESTAPVATSASTSSCVHWLVGSSFSFVPG